MTTTHLLGPDMAAGSRAADLADKLKTYQTAMYAAAVAERVNLPQSAAQHRQDARNALAEWPTVLAAVEGHDPPNSVDAAWRTLNDLARDAREVGP